MIQIYTDGGCIGNPGPGGYAVVIIKHGKIIHEHSQSYKYTTNNRMEYRACLYALQQIKAQSLKNVTLYTDSKYVLESVNNWGHKWKKLGWARNKSGTDKIQNVDLFKACYLLNEELNVCWQWIKGHAGNLGNKRADELANRAAQFPLDSVLEDELVIDVETEIKTSEGLISLF